MIKKHCKYISPLFISLLTAGCAGTPESGQSVIGKVDSGLATIGQTAQTGRQTIEAGTAIASSVPATQTALTEALVGQLGVTQQQALGGAGAIFQAAKTNMTEQAFAGLSQSVPGMSEMLAAAPQVGGAAMLGGAGGTIGTMQSLYSSFSQLNLSPGMVNQFIPVVVDYVSGTSGQATSNLLRSALMP
ncbi:DUF2780 domain-containing protein [Methylotuvimicrobium alcaliphilum]|jgi:hypothetical protein|uniref:DUF2780 domain-containing protein n=1 Tax=Methylotuvimicrobium alcaliphilum (strain DSM 19304 / NCIMB 14124 / VKM B-2133 / 20Z) TaxID=1091494 RepID=G4T0J5_META2|nr:DUF2780 domain-containing protein [Methylotuvimicrobium alcaliphilum]CCE25599.1 conserved exported protein of unknown function [Methylotuvimicrobium alcaliphilum 20Z]